MFKVNLTGDFKKKFKALSKRYSRIKHDVFPIIDFLEKWDFIGDNVKGISNVYKVRLKSSEQNKGKSGGFRTVYYVVNRDKIVFLLTIYAKADKENILPKELKEIIKNIEK